MKDAIAAVLLLVSIAALFPGVVTLIDPKSFKLRTRWDALPMLTAWIAGFGCVFFAIPAQNGDRPWILGVTLIVIWAGLFRWSWVKSVGAQARAEEQDRLNPDRSAEQVDARTRDTRRQRIERERAEEKARLRIEHEKAFNAARAAAAREQAKPKRSHHKKRPEPEVDADPTTPRNSSGKLARFVYVDADGVVTDRRVKNWTSDRFYLEGHCQLRREHRTFRLDRIEEWISG